jgi:peptidoglycan/LPS O-acetylase OafA/YrhL
MPPPEPAATSRFDTVDLLRGISILLVILLHTYIRTHFAVAEMRAVLPPSLFHLLLQNGDNGVTIFFAISGFLIAFTSIQRFGSLALMQPLRFYRIRLARIGPLLLLLLAVLSILDLIHADGFVIDPKRESLPGALFAALTFHLNWYEAVHGYLPANWDILWSLSVEEMFYLFFPIVCLLLLRWKRGLYAFIALLLAFVAMGPFARALWTHNPIWQDDTYLGGMDAIALGCLTALAAANLGAPPSTVSSFRVGFLTARKLLVIQTFGAILIFWILLWPTWLWIRPIMRFLGRHGLDGTILPLGTCLVIFASVLRARPGRLWTAPVRWFGRHSYEVYLTHEFVVVWGSALFASLHKQQRSGPIAIWFAAILLATAPLGWLVTRFYSEPMNRRLRGALPPT